MRFIGNKTKLLPAIDGFVADLGIERGRVLDVFTGSASVARHFKAAGWSVAANDLLTLSVVLARAALDVNAAPEFAGLGGRGGFDKVRSRLDALPPIRGFFHRHFSPAGPAGRMYFTPENAARIDAIHDAIARWRGAGFVGEAEFHLLLAALIDAAGRVANISGVYAAYLKEFQSNAVRPLALDAPEVIPSRRRHRVFQGDGVSVAARHPCDLLYVDPPYNHRQYAANYHVLEVLAELHRVDDCAAYGATLYGKTGMRPYRGQLSEFCRNGTRDLSASPCARALHALVAGARARHVVLSYSEEGILDRETIGRVLASAAGLARFDFDRDFREISYKRFRSDKDGAARAYRVIDGRRRDEVREWLFHVEKPPYRVAGCATRGPVSSGASGRCGA